MSTPKKLLLAFGILVVLFGTCAYLYLRSIVDPLVAQSEANWVNLRAIYQNEVKQILPKLIADDERIRHDGLFVIAGTRDAGPWLNLLVEWNPKLAKPAPLTLDPEWKTRLEGLEGIQNVANNTKLALPDTRWMSELKNYDYWDLWSGGPLEGEKTPQNHTFPDDRDPNFNALITWTKIRLARGLREKNIKDAVFEVRQLAKLSFSTEHLVGGMSAMAMLLSEPRVAGEITRAGIHPFDRDGLSVYKRYIWAMNELTLPLGTPETLAVLRNKQTLSVGTCIALHQGGEAANALRPLTHGVLEAWYKEFDAVLAARTDCRLSALRPSWNHPVFFSKYYSGTIDLLTQLSQQARSGQLGTSSEAYKFPTPATLDAHPQLRDAIAKVLLQIAVPDFSRFYKESK